MTIEPDEQSTVDPPQMRSTWRAPLQNIELMPQRQNLGFELPSRLEAVAQQAEEQEPQRDHAVMMF